MAFFTLSIFRSHDFELYLNIDFVTFAKALLKNVEKLLNSPVFSSLDKIGPNLLLRPNFVMALEVDKLGRSETIK